MKLNSDVYFVRKESPKQRDWRFGYQRTPESALHYYVGEYVIKSRDIGKSGSVRNVKTFHKIAKYKTHDEAVAAAAKWNAELKTIIERN